jgi:anaerobic magnesium-protoporphyrin IX monomethyl ester cyclase
VSEVLLTHSYHLAYDRKQVRKMQPYPPLGTLYAAGVLRQHGISVGVFDAMLQEPEAGFREALRTHQPKIVAIYEDDFNFLTKMCLTRMREVAFQMIEDARRAGAKVVVHGSDETDRAAEYLEQGSELVLIGEAEHTLLDVVRSISTGGDTTSVPGVAFLRRHGTENVIEKRRPGPVRQFAGFPAPARDLIDLGIYRDAWLEAHGTFSLNLIASRGCPFQCNWCAKPIFGDSYHVRAADEVADEIKELRQRYGATHLWFADDIFALNRHWTEQFAQAMEKRRCRVPFKIQARADLLTADSVRALRRAGCAEVWMGIESGSQKVLDAMDKGLRVEKIIAARAALRREGIKACYFLQFGYPGETWSDLQDTISLVRGTRPDDIGVSFSYPLPNTRFHERVRQQLGDKQNWSDSDDLCVMFKGAYSDTFYRSVRDALHAEVDSWKPGAGADENVAGEVGKLWDRVKNLEPMSRNLDPTELPEMEAMPRRVGSEEQGTFVPLHGLAASAGEA